MHCRSDLEWCKSIFLCWKWNNSFLVLTEHLRGRIFLESFTSCSWFGLLVLIFDMTQLRDWEQGRVKCVFYWKYSLTFLQLGAKLSCSLLIWWRFLLCNLNTDLRREEDPAVLFLLSSYLPVAPWEHIIVREWPQRDSVTCCKRRAGTFIWLLSCMDLLIQRAVILCLMDPLHHRGLKYFTCVALNLLLLSEPSEHISIQFPWSIMQGRKWSHFILTVSSAGWENLMAETFIFTGTVVVTNCLFANNGKGKGLPLSCPTRPCVH